MRLQALFIAFGPWQHGGLLPMTGSSALDVTQSKDLVHTSSSLPEACLLLPNLGVNGCLHPVEEDSTEHLAWDRQEGDSTPVVAVLDVAFLGDFDNKTFGPVFRDGVTVPDVLEEVRQHTC